MSDSEGAEAIQRMHAQFVEFAERMLAAQEQILAGVLKIAEEQRKSCATITNVNTLVGNRTEYPSTALERDVHHD